MFLNTFNYNVMPLNSLVKERIEHDQNNSPAPPDLFR